MSHFVGGGVSWIDLYRNDICCNPPSRGDFVSVNRMQKLSRRGVILHTLIISKFVETRNSNSEYAYFSSINAAITPAH